MNKYYHRIIIFTLFALIGCNKIAYLPNVTDEVAVTANSATITFEVDRGDESFCPQVEYDTDSRFRSSKTVEAHVVDGCFEAVLDSLERNTTYYYRFVVSNSAGGGIIVDNRETFITPNILVKVITSEISDFSTDGATCSLLCGGTVSVEGGDVSITRRGVCWGVKHSPTIIDGNYADEGEGTGDYSVRLTDLPSNAYYYFRAYAVSSLGVTYGNEVEFGANGAMSSLFSVSETLKVRFSHGNLQYKASTNTWRFAEQQWDIVGENNSNISQAYDGWIDVFGWGTSGYNHGANCYQPWGTDSNASDYYAYGDAAYNLYDKTGMADWGYNAISNGGYQENSGWRTLTMDEWRYVVRERKTTSGIRYAFAVVNDVNGMLLLPDDWDNSIFPLNQTNMIMHVNYNDNVINAEQWTVVESAGAVFLPAAGERRIYSGISYVNTEGYYWSSSQENDREAGNICFNESFGCSMIDVTRYNGLSVRLVLDDR